MPMAWTIFWLGPILLISFYFLVLRRAKPIL